MKYKDVSATLIVYETANRLADSLQDILTVLGNREMAVVREITKKFEEVKRDFVENLIAYYEENGLPKGEIVIVIDRMTDTQTIDTTDVDALIRQTLEQYSVRDTVSIVVGITNLPKKEIYKRVLELTE